MLDSIYSFDIGSIGEEEFISSVTAARQFVERLSRVEGIRRSLLVVGTEELFFNFSETVTLESRPRLREDLVREVALATLVGGWLFVTVEGMASTRMGRGAFVHARLYGFGLEEGYVEPLCEEDLKAVLSAARCRVFAGCVCADAAELVEPVAAGFQGLLVRPACWGNIRAFVDAVGGRR